MLNINPVSLTADRAYIGHIIGYIVPWKTPRFYVHHTLN